MMQGWNVHQSEQDTSSWSWKKQEHLLPGVRRSWNAVGLAGAGTNRRVQKLELEQGRERVHQAARKARELPHNALSGASAAWHSGLFPQGDVTPDPT